MNPVPKQPRAIVLIGLTLLFLVVPGSQAQQLEVSFSQFRQFSQFGSEGGSGGFPNGPIGHRDRGPGSVSFGGTTTAKTGPGMALIVLGTLAPGVLLLLDLNVEMTSGLSGPQAFPSATARNRCNLVAGNIGGFLQNLVAAGFPVFALTNAVANHIQGTPHLGAIACSTFHSNSFGDLRDGAWNLTVAGATNGSAIADIGLSAGGSNGGVSVAATPVRALQLPGNVVETIQYRYACLEGLEWDGVENRCVCKTYPPGTQHPLEECRPEPLNCGPRQIEREGACIDCGPGTVPFNNECVPVDGGPEDECPEGSPCFCATNPEHGACIHCEGAHGVIYHDGDPIGDPQDHIVCESTFPWVSGASGNQALLDCLYFDLVCYLSHGRAKTVPDPSEVPPTQHLRACSEGLGWIACGDPGYRELVPANDYLELLPECHVSSTGIPITTCGTTLPDGQTTPDLVVEDPRIMTTHPTAGQPILFTFDVANRGTEAAPNATWKVQAETPSGVRSLTGVIGSLPVGSHRTFELSSADVPFIPEPGPLSIRVTVDHSHSVAELNENNNTRLMATLVTEGTTTGGVDLIANVTGTTIENPVVDQEVTVFVTVTNVGQAPAPESVLLVSVTDPAGNWLPEQHDVGPIGPGQSVTQSVVVNGDRAGSLWLTARADAGFDVAEDVESNNDATFGLQYAEPDVCLPCTSGAPNNGVGSLVCLPSWDNIEAEGGQFQCYGVRPDGTTCSPGGDHPNGWYEIGLRCPDPWTLCEGVHPDRCGIPAICPGTAVCD